MSRSGPHAALGPLAAGCAAADNDDGPDGPAASRGADADARRSREHLEECSAAAFSQEAHRSLVPYEDSDSEREECVQTYPGATLLTFF